VASLSDPTALMSMMGGREPDKAAMAGMLCQTNSCRSFLASMIPPNQMPGGIDMQQAISCFCSEPTLQSVATSGGNMTLDAMSTLCTSNICRPLFTAGLAAEEDIVTPGVTIDDVISCACMNENTRLSIMCADPTFSIAVQDAARCPSPESGGGLHGALDSLCSSATCAQMVDFMAAKEGTEDTCAQTTGPSQDTSSVQERPAAAETEQANSGGGGGSGAAFVFAVLLVVGLAGGGGWLYFKTSRKVAAQSKASDVAVVVSPAPDTQVNSMNELNDAARAAAAQGATEQSQERL